jgi:hypothetical protein
MPAACVAHRPRISLSARQRTRIEPSWPSELVGFRRSRGGICDDERQHQRSRRGGALYAPGIFGALFYYWQQADAFWEYVWAIFPKAIFWPAYMVYEGFRALGS